jgi:CubicO group peptidase (beta-lactamase class C family)
LGSFIAEELAGPLGLDMHLGLALEEHHRAAALYGSSISTALRRFGPRMLRGRTTEGRLYRSVLFNRGSESYKALLNPDPGPRRLECLNEPENRTMQLPWMNMHTNGPSLSRLYAVLAEGGELDGVRLMDAATIAPLHHAQSWSDMDRVLQKPLGFSQGFQKEELTLFSPEGSWMGHSGMGGSLGFADPHHRMSFAYVQNALSPYIRSPRCVRLCRAAYKSLGVL